MKGDEQADFFVFHKEFSFSYMAAPQYPVADDRKRLQVSLCRVICRDTVVYYSPPDACFCLHSHFFPYIRTQDRRNSFCAMAFLRSPALDHVHRNREGFSRRNRKEQESYYKDIISLGNPPARRDRSCCNRSPYRIRRSDIPADFVRAVHWPLYVDHSLLSVMSDTLFIGIKLDCCSS